MPAAKKTDETIHAAIVGTTTSRGIGNEPNA